MKRSSHLSVMVVLASFVVCGVADATPALNFDPGSLFTPATMQAEGGWSFVTNQAITITALGAYDPLGTDRTGSPGMVFLYDTQGTTLTSVQVTTTDPQDGTPPFYYAAITPITLAAGGTYYIAENADSDTMTFVTVTNLMVDPAIGYIGPVGAVGQNTNPMTDVLADAFAPAYFGANFEFEAVLPEPAEALPEPASLLILGGGMIGLGLLRRRRAQRASS